MKLRLSQKREIEMLRTLRSSITRERRELIAMRADCEKRMEAFREVCTVAWDVCMGTGDISDLQKSLEATDHHWEAFAGCVGDPAPPVN